MAGRLKLALWIGAAIWAFLLVVGFFAPGNWVWGLPGPIGHMENFMISLWFVGLVLAPLLASRDPLERTSTIQVYLLAVLGIVVSTFRGGTHSATEIGLVPRIAEIVVSTVRGDELKWIADGPTLVACAIAIGLVVWLHPHRSVLWHW